MSEVLDVEIEEENFLEDDHKAMPFRLGDMELGWEFSSLSWLGGIGTTLDSIRKEWKFQFKLALHEWGRNHWVALSLACVAFLLGAISGEVISGGDATVSGIDGLTGAMGGFDYFQLLTSLLIWLWFVVMISNLFPVMRTHSLVLLLSWNAIFVSMILFHQNNTDFPVDLKLADMMWGTLILLIVFFLLYSFVKAVIETRDLHVEMFHVNEDVRVMEAAMSEHSLRGWAAMLGIWLGTIMFSSWAGAHFISERVALPDSDRTLYLILHVISGLLIIPMFMWIVWFPQRMLGDNTRVRTKAAVLAEADLLGEGSVGKAASQANCPECDAPQQISRNSSGEITMPCPVSGCTASGIIGSECSKCGESIPTRHSCDSCGVNAPVIEYLPDMEAW